MVVCLKHVGITDSIKDMLKTSVKTPASWSARILIATISQRFLFRRLSGSLPLPDFHMKCTHFIINLHIAKLILLKV
jgi:hypothetical protein